MSSNFYEWLKKEGTGKLSENHPLKKYTTWRIGGLAELFYEPSNKEDCLKVYIKCVQENVPVTFIGGGSNLLISDNGIAGLVIYTKGLSELEWLGESVRADAGLSLTYLSKMASEKGLSGLEFAAGIPGTLGGAVVMNAGANGHSISEVVKEVKVITKQGELKIYSNKELDFSYRSSILQKTKELVLSVDLSLEKGDAIKIKRKIEENLRFRKERQPIKLPNAGSVFKNPQGDSAGRLIEAVGAKGWRVGDAQVSKLHANFIVNLGDANANDVNKLIEEVRQAVLEKFAIVLETEVILLGFDDNRR